MEPPRISARSLLMDKVRLVVYGMLAGLVIGMILGWMFHGLVGFLVRMVVVLALLVPLAAAVLFWHKTTSDRDRARSSTDISEARWRDAEPPSSRGRR